MQIQDYVKGVAAITHSASAIFCIYAVLSRLWRLYMAHEEKRSCIWKPAEFVASRHLNSGLRSWQISSSPNDMCKPIESKYFAECGRGIRHAATLQAKIRW